MNALHYNGEAFELRSPICGRVPKSVASTTTAWESVTCKYCLAHRAEKETNSEENHATFHDAAYLMRSPGELPAASDDFLQHVVVSNSTPPPLPFKHASAPETSAKCAHQHPDRQPTDTYCRDCGEPLETFFAPVGRPMPLTHWSKDPLVPYADCKCQTCAYARGDLQFTTTDSTTQNRGV